MRLAINTRFLLPGKLEGLGWYTHEIVRRMVAAHPEDEFVFLFDRPYAPAFLYGPNVVPVVVHPPARHPLLWYAWFEWSVPLVLKRFKPEVFFSPDSFLSLHAKVRTVMTVHDILPLEYPGQIPWSPRIYYRNFLPKYLHRAERLITISEYVKHAMVEKAGISPEKIAVVHNGCRDNFRALTEMEKAGVRKEYTGGRPYFFYTGAIHPRKNVDRLILAFDRFKTSTGAAVMLLLAGRKAWHTGAVDRAWVEARHRDDIRFLGYVPEPELPRLMAAAHALVYVSLAEGFGLPVLEAMQCEVPVLCSGTSSLPEVAGDAALLVNPESEDEIYLGLKKIYSDEIFRTGLFPKMKNQVTRFDWDRAAEKVYCLLND